MRLLGGRDKKDEQIAGRRRQVTPRPEATPSVPSFRRNRTITDRSTVPEVSERARIHQLRMMRRKVGMTLGVTLLALAVIMVGISQFTQSVRVVIPDTSVVGQPDTAFYQRHFDEYFKRYPLERFRFITNYDQLSQWMQESAPEVAKVTPRGLQSLGVAKYELRLREPLVSWRVNDEQYYVDTNGVTFKRNYFTPPTVSVVDKSGAEIEQGAAIASGRLLSFVGRAVALAAENGVKVTQVEIPSGSMRQVYLHGEGVPVIRMTIDRGVEYQVADMKRTLTFLATSGQTPQYIDVRTAGKAFYKE